MGFDDNKDYPENIPKEPGYYWARTAGYGWWNLIVHIKGDTPYLHYRGWNLSEEKQFSGNLPYNIYFGPRIQDPTPPDLFYQALSRREGT